MIKAVIHAPAAHDVWSFANVVALGSGLVSLVALCATVIIAWREVRSQQAEYRTRQQGFARSLDTLVRDFTGKSDQFLEGTITIEAWIEEGRGLARAIPLLAQAIQDPEALLASARVARILEAVPSRPPDAQDARIALVRETENKVLQEFGPITAAAEPSPPSSLGAGRLRFLFRQRA